MVEFNTTRHNPLVDPVLTAWSWEIPVYLFVGGCVAGMMVLGGVSLLRAARGEDPKRWFSLHAPLLAFMLLNLGLLALLLDLAHKFYAWRVYLTFQPTAPMSWGSWVLLFVYAVLALSVLVKLPQSWPWLGARVPLLARIATVLQRPSRLRLLGIANLVLGIGVGSYTGVLLATMGARPLWNSPVLPLLFLTSGLAAGSAMLYLAAAWRGEGPAPQGLLAGAIASLAQPLGDAPPPAEMRRWLMTVNVVLLAIEGVLIALWLLHLNSASPSHAAAAALLTQGSFATKFWTLDIALALVLPIALQLAMLARRLPASVVPALLVLAGGLTLRWVIVNAGQASQLLSVASIVP